MRTAAGRHWAAIAEAMPASRPADLRGYEFGAGWHLGVALVLAGEGVGTQVLVDRSPLARPDLVMETLAACAAELGSPRLSAAAREADVDGVLRVLGIRYLAPCDARSTGIPDGSVDFVTSTSTLEHIPEQDLPLVLAECHRVLRPGGVLSALIDYGDHYAHTDPSITSVNFLTFGPHRWRLFSPPLHFQNRLRHGDNVAMIEGAGFEITSQTVARGTEADRALVTSSRVHAAYRGRDVEDLTARDAHIVARKPGPR